MKDVNIVWHPYPQEKPPKDKEYLVSVTAGNTRFSSADFWHSKKEVFHHFIDASITAWAEMPEPYYEEE